jgi:SAM-dependent methyltransferase
VFEGAARYYLAGRFPYPQHLGQTLADALPLDGRQRLLDVGCGPGSLTLLLARRAGTAVGMDIARAMVREASLAAERASIRNVRFLHLAAEALPADLGLFDVITFARSFHWLDRSGVAATVRQMLNPGGAVVHVHATTHRGDTGDDPLSLPRPPYEAIDGLVRAYLGPPTPNRLSGEDTVYRAAGFDGPRRIEIPAGEIVERSVDAVVASVFSLSTSSPALFGTARQQFEAQLRKLLSETSPSGRFAERTIAADIWR